MPVRKHSKFVVNTVLNGKPVQFSQKRLDVITLTFPEDEAGRIMLYLVDRTECHTELNYNSRGEMQCLRSQGWQWQIQKDMVG